MILLSCFQSTRSTWKRDAAVTRCWLKTNRPIRASMRDRKSRVIQSSAKDLATWPNCCRHDDPWAHGSFSFTYKWKLLEVLFYKSYNTIIVSLYILWFECCSMFLSVQYENWIFSGARNRRVFKSTLPANKPLFQFALDVSTITSLLGWSEIAQ